MIVIFTFFRPTFLLSKLSERREERDGRGGGGAGLVRIENTLKTAWHDRSK
jgi:hypothetical protein